jgi:hypothetical protein
MIAIAKIIITSPPTRMRIDLICGVTRAEVETCVNAKPAKIAARYKPTNLSHMNIPPSTLLYAKGGTSVFNYYVTLVK